MSRIILKLFTATLSLIINFIFLNYVKKIEKDTCKCAENDWRKDYIKYFSMVSISLITVSLFVDVKTCLGRNTGLILVILLQCANIINLYALYSYSKKLKDDECACSNDWERDLIYNYSMIMALIYIMISTINMFAVIAFANLDFYKFCGELLNTKPKKI
jgi:uncharacterized membrane protein